MTRAYPVKPNGGSVPLRVADRRQRRWLLITAVAVATSITLDALNIIGWDWKTGLASSALILAVMRLSRWSAYADGRRAADWDAWNRHQAGEL